MRILQVGVFLGGSCPSGNFPGGSFHVADIILQESAVTCYFNVFKIKKLF